MYVATFALLSCYERVFIPKKNCIFHDFGIMDLRTTEPFRSDSRTLFVSNLRTFGLKNLRTHEPSNLRTFGLIGCNLIVISYNITFTSQHPFQFVVIHFSLSTSILVCGQWRHLVSTRQPRISRRWNTMTCGTYLAVIQTLLKRSLTFVQ